MRLQRATAHIRQLPPARVSIALASLAVGTALIALGAVALARAWTRWPRPAPGILVATGTALAVGGLSCCYWRPARAQAGQAQGPQEAGSARMDVAVEEPRADLEIVSAEEDSETPSQREARAWLQQLHERQPDASPDALLGECIAAVSECARRKDLNLLQASLFQEALSQLLARRYSEVYGADDARLRLLRHIAGNEQLRWGFIQTYEESLPQELWDALDRELLNQIQPFVATEMTRRAQAHLTSLVAFFRRVNWRESYRLDGLGIRILGRAISSLAQQWLLADESIDGEMADGFRELLNQFQTC